MSGAARSNESWNREQLAQIEKYEKEPTHWLFGIYFSVTHTQQLK